ncbi:ABC transporter substrate-binding protein [Muricomes intestini]|uniref:ABC transporter substrate-binding protein n=1 Tax=Muricomes intestini TaxID=1796634 RepID=UPI002FE29D9C
MKRFRILAMAMGVVMALTACGGKQGKDESDSQSKKPGDKDQITITYESWTPTKEYMDRILTAFHKEHPEINVEVTLHANASEYMTAVQTAFASGEGPDVFMFADPTALNQLKSQIEPLDQYCTDEWGESWADDFVASAIGDNSIDGVPYGLPMPTARPEQCGTTRLYWIR